jgi:hypothetical protein
MLYSLGELETELCDLKKFIVSDISEPNKDFLLDKVHSLLLIHAELETEFDSVQAELDDANDEIESLESDMNELENSCKPNTDIPVMTVIDELKMKVLQRLFTDKTLDQLESIV